MFLHTARRLNYESKRAENVYRLSLDRCIAIDTLNLKFEFETNKQYDCSRSHIFSNRKLINHFKSVAQQKIQMIPAAHRNALFEGSVSILRVGYCF